MAIELSNPSRRRVIATMTRGKSKKPILTRRYSYFDTALPRMLQLSLSYANEGDFITFDHDSYGQIGVLHILPRGRFEMVMNPIVKDAPSLLKLMNEDPYWGNTLVEAAMK